MRGLQCSPPPAWISTFHRRFRALHHLHRCFRALRHLHRRFRALRHLHRRFRALRDLHRRFRALPHLHRRLQALPHLADRDMIVCMHVNMCRWTHPWKLLWYIIYHMSLLKMDTSMHLLCRLEANHFLDLAKEEAL